MSNRVLRAGFVAVPALCLAFAFVSAACDEEDPAAGGTLDASVDVTPLSDAQVSNGNRDGSVSTNTDSGDAGDGGTDADAEPPPPLCEIYPDTDMAEANGEVEWTNRYDFIANRALVTAAENARGTCGIANHFSEDVVDAVLPRNLDCLGRELAAIAGCKIQTGDGLKPLDYTTLAQDKNGFFCIDDPVNDPVLEKVHLGFRNPATNGYKLADVKKVIELVTAQAIAVGKMTPADAARLKAGMEARINTVVLTTDGDDGNTFSNPCTPPEQAR